MGLEATASGNELKGIDSVVIGEGSKKVKIEPEFIKDISGTKYRYNYLIRVWSYAGDKKGFPLRVEECSKENVAEVYRSLIAEFGGKEERN